jgi:hypothetical protein
LGLAGRKRRARPHASSPKNPSLYVAYMAILITLTFLATSWLLITTSTALFLKLEMRLLWGWAVYLMASSCWDHIMKVPLFTATLQLIGNPCMAHMVAITNMISVATEFSLS